MMLDVVMVQLWTAWLSGLQWPNGARCCNGCTLASLDIRTAVAFMALNVVMVPLWPALLSGKQWHNVTRCSNGFIVASLAIRAVLA